MNIQWRNTGKFKPVLATGATFKGNVVEFKGQGNTLWLGAGAQFNGLVEFHGSGHKIVIGPSARFRGKIIVKGKAVKVEFGAHSTTVSAYLLAQDADISVGRWCMFSREVELRTTDAHSVIDVASGRRTNPDAPVCVGDHVWVGVGTLVSKGAVIPSDTIVGAKSFVNSAFVDEQTVIAGVPARVVRTGVTWNRSRKKRYTKDEINHWR